jgi:histidinol phosphatase-like enzyme (inositol monophosphatase family)
MIDLNELLETAKKIAKIGGDSTKKYFNNGIAVNLKEDESPVTIADKEAEKIMRQEIEKHFPTHGIIGEEYGAIREDSNIQWVLDPIDGTKSFIHGVPLYTTLIGVLIDGIPQVGIIYQPILDELCYAATGLGCYLNGKKTKVRELDNLSNASMMITELKHFEEKGYLESHNKLMNATRYHRTWGDAYGHMMVATGRADIMFDPILNIWDAAALHPIIREAGGWFGSAEGNEALVDQASGISCHPVHKDEILAFF